MKKTFTFMYNFMLLPAALMGVAMAEYQYARIRPNTHTRGDLAGHILNKHWEALLVFSVVFWFALGLLLGAWLHKLFT